VRTLLGLAAALAFPAGAQAAVTLAQVGTFVRPVAIAAPPADTSRVFVAEQDGRVMVLRDGGKAEAPFLDIGAMGLSHDVAPDPGGASERGLLGLAFSPDYAATGRFYVYYTGAADGHLHVDEFRRGATADLADPATRRSVLTIPHDRQANHNGGQLQFGPDGMLYAGTGDGGGGNDPANNGQNLDSATPAVVGGANHHPLLGKILRIDPRSATPYGIPAGQPDFGGAAHRPEIWAYGLRNPFRFSFDRSTGDLAIGDVGQNAWEEIDFAPAPAAGAGLNFGWDALEGNHATTNGTPLVGTPTPAVIEHGRSEGWCSIIGGYVIRDPALPDLLGQYVYGDWCKGEVWAARLGAGGAADNRALALPKIASMSSFGEDACGRVYLASLQGPVYRFSATGECGAAGAGAPGAGGRDRTAPRISLRARSPQRPLRTGRLRLTARCSEQCRLLARGSLRIGGAAVGVSSATARVTLAARVRVPLALRVSRKARRRIASALRRGRRVGVVFTVRAADGAGNARKTRTVIRLVK
jgi:glucose/arabinose dehydrogenase